MLFEKKLFKASSGVHTIGSSFTLAPATGWSTLSSMNANTTAYLYYQIIGVSGTGSGAGDHTEIEFKTADIAESGKVTRIHGTSLAWS